MENGSLDLVSVTLLHIIFRAPDKEMLQSGVAFPKLADKLILDKKLRHLHLSLITREMGPVKGVGNRLLIRANIKKYPA